MYKSAYLLQDKFSGQIKLYTKPIKISSINKNIISGVRNNVVIYDFIFNIFIIY